MASEKFETVDSEGDNFDGHRTTPKLEEGGGSEYAGSVGQDVLREQEEAEGLLASGATAVIEKSLGRRVRGWFGQERTRAVGQSRRNARRSKRNESEAEQEVLYNFEESDAVKEDNGEGSDTAIEAEAQSDAPVSARRKRLIRNLAVLCGTLIIIYGAWIGLSSAPGIWTEDTKTFAAQKLSNGTHTFAPTTLLISLDGFRADFLGRNLTPALNGLVRAGVSPPHMVPSFPSLTFPNHFTLVTGLHPEAHGIVGNTFWDPAASRQFIYTDRTHSMQPEWWLGEPIWLTAERAGVVSAIHMWPGSEAHIGDREPTYVDVYNAHEKLENKVARILGWLDLPGREDADAIPETPRPQLIAAYVPNVDTDGHRYGPNSTEIRTTIGQVDDMISSLVQGIDARNLTDIVNIIIVSDHGMATTSTSRLIQLEDLIDTSVIDHIDGWPLYGLRPRNNTAEHIRELHDMLLAKSQQPAYSGKFSVFLRDSTMPERWHFSSNPRIAPIWLVPQAGWAIVTKDEVDVARAQADGTAYSPAGLHGYDHQHPLMRAIFIARGPAFPHEPGSKLDVFQNIEVYNLVCDSLGLTPTANNGTLRLPLTPNGRHDFEAEIDIPVDNGSLEHNASDSGDKAGGSSSSSSINDQINHKDDNTISDKATHEDATLQHVSWWDWVVGQIDSIKGLAGNISDRISGSRRKDRTNG